MNKEAKDIALEIGKQIIKEGAYGGTVKVFWNEIVKNFSIPPSIEKEVKHHVQMFINGANSDISTVNFKVKMKDKKTFGLF